MLAVLCTCEWTYLSWASARIVTAVEELHTEWIYLHLGEYFTSVVEYLRGLLDKEGPLMTEAEKEKCKARFLQTVQLEEEFFDNAYSS